MTGLTREAAGKIRLLRFNLLVVTERVREILTPAFFSELFLQLFLSVLAKKRGKTIKID